jgi:hypothetical protein
MDEAVLERRVFEAGERVFVWRDVVDAARAAGDWDPIERAGRESLACLRHAGTVTEPVDERDLEQAADEWRYARNLIAAEEVQQWLARFGLSVDEWSDWVRASQLRVLWSKHLDEFEAERPISDRAIASAAWVEAVASGDLEAFAVRLAERVAVHVVREGGRLPAAAELELSFERFRKEVVTPGALERQLSDHALEWTRIDCRCLTAPGESVAREAVLCVMEDGMELQEVAAQAGRELEEHSYHLDGSAGVLAEALVGARPGDVLGPIRLENGFAVLLVLERVPPSAEDLVMRERAERQVVNRALEGMVSRRVRWHEELMARDHLRP